MIVVRISAVMEVCVLTWLMTSNVPVLEDGLEDSAKIVVMGMCYSLEFVVSEILLSSVLSLTIFVY